MAKTENKIEQIVTSGTTEQVESNPLMNLESAFLKNRKSIQTTGIVLLLLIGGYLAYTQLYKAPREAKAADKIFAAQQYFAADSINLALNGDGQHAGFAKVIREFDGTKAGNLAQYYAGICYLKTGDFKKAIKCLEDFDAKGTVLATAAAGALGSAYWENKNLAKAIESFEKATSDKDDIIQTPIYLQNLGYAYEANKQPEKAIIAFKRIKDEFPTSMQSRDIDRDLARLGAID